MRALGGPLALSKRSPSCPLQRLGRREVVEAYALVPLEQLVADGARTSTSIPAPQPVHFSSYGPGPGQQLHRIDPHRRPYQQYQRLGGAEHLVRHVDHVSGAPAESARGPSLTPAELMLRIKDARSWQQLQTLVDAYGRSMNHLHVSAVVTHMAQLHTSSSGGSGGDAESMAGASSREPAADRNDSGGRHSSTGSVPDAPQDVPLSQHNARASHSQAQAQDVPAARAPPKPPEPGAQGQGPGCQRQLPPLPPPPPPPWPASGSSTQPQPLSRPRDRGAFLQQLQDEVAARLPNFRARQLANTLWAFGKLGYRPPAPWIAALLAHMHAQLPACEPQHLANTLYGLMLLGYMPPSTWLVDFFHAVNARLHSFKPVELAHLCYAAGKLHVAPSSEVLGGLFHHSQVNISHYGMRELALLLYGLVHMGGKLHYVWMRNYRLRVSTLVVQSGAVPLPLLRQWGPQLHPTAMGTVVEEQLRRQAADEKRPRRSGGGQGGGGAAAAAAGRQQGPHADAQAAAMATNLATVLASMADWLYQPPQPFLEVVLGALSRSARHLDPVQLTGLLLTLAHLRYRPQPELFEEVWEVIMDSFDDLSRQHRTNAIWAVSRLRYPVPRNHMNLFFTRAAMELYDHTDGEIVALLAAATGLRFRPRLDWLLLVESHLFRRLPKLKPFELVAVLQHMADLRHKPERPWMAQWSTSAQQGLVTLGLQPLAVAAHAAARLGFRPPAQFRAELLRVTAKRMAALLAAEQGEVGVTTMADLRGHSGKRPRTAAVARRVRTTRAQLRSSFVDGTVEQRPEALSRLLWSLAMLDIRPDAEWLDAYMACLQSCLEHCMPRELSLVMWALARFGHNPGPQWMAVFRRRAALAGAVMGQALSGEEDEAPSAHAERAPAPLHIAAGAHSTSGQLEQAADPGQPVADVCAGVDFSRIILQGITVWAERQLAAANQDSKARGQAFTETF